MFKSNNIYILIGIVIATPLIETTTFRTLPKSKIGGYKAKKKRLKQSKPNSFNKLRDDSLIIQSPLNQLSWREFERLCFLYFKAKGYSPLETSNGADGGVDLIIYNKHHKTHEAIQIKHYISSGNQITVKEIRELNSAKRNHNCILARFITSSTYSMPALREADKYKIECHDINWVKNNIVKWQRFIRKNQISSGI